MSDPFIAEIRIMPTNFAPRFWAFCNGQILPIAQNTALFSLLGTTYGGDGRTTFALPDLAGRLPMNPGQAPGLSNRVLGEELGSETVTLSEAEMPAHSHVLRGFETAEAANPTGTRGLGAANVYATPGTLVPMDADVVAPAGGGEAHSNAQPFLALNFCIALTGVFPPRG